MASDEPTKVTVPITGTPRNMRPRATPNAEINAQRGDEFRYSQGVFDRPEVKDVSPRGYARGGSIKPPNTVHQSSMLGYENGGKVVPDKPSTKY